MSSRIPKPIPRNAAMTSTTDYSSGEDSTTDLCGALALQEIFSFWEVYCCYHFQLTWGLPSYYGNVQWNVWSILWMAGHFVRPFSDSYHKHCNSHQQHNYVQHMLQHMHSTCACELHVCAFLRISTYVCVCMCSDIGAGASHHWEHSLDTRQTQCQGIQWETSGKGS